MQQLKADYNQKLARAKKAWDWAETATPAEFEKHFSRFDALNKEMSQMMRQIGTMTREEKLNGFDTR